MLVKSLESSLNGLVAAVNNGIVGTLPKDVARNQCLEQAGEQVL